MNTLAPLYSPTTAKRFSYSGVWSLNALQTDLVVSDDQFLLCGLTMYPYPGNSDDPSVSNISPVMVDIETNGTSYAQSHISVFLNNSGTGNPASNYNSYYTQGWGVSNIAWNPVFADRWGLYPNNIYLTAPKWENGILAFKWKKLALVGTSGYEMPTDCGQYFTEPEFFDDEVIQPCTTAVTDPLQLITIFNGCDTASLDMTADDCSASDYKPSVVSAEKTYYKPELYPNPAQNTLEVKGLKKDATYTMIDVNGRRLLSGKLSTYNSDIDISQLPAGMYLLELNENKKIMRMKFLKE